MKNSFFKTAEPITYLHTLEYKSNDHKLSLVQFIEKYKNDIYTIKKDNVYY